MFRSDTDFLVCFLVCFFEVGKREGFADDNPGGGEVGEAKGDADDAVVHVGDVEYGGCPWLSLFVGWMVVEGCRRPAAIVPGGVAASCSTLFSLSFQSAAAASACGVIDGGRLREVRRRDAVTSELMVQLDASQGCFRFVPLIAAWAVACEIFLCYDATCATWQREVT